MTCRCESYYNYMCEECRELLERATRKKDSDKYARIKRLTDEDREEILTFALKRSDEIHAEWASNDTPSENKRAKRRRELGYDEPSMDERTDNINQVIESLDDTLIEKGE